MIRMMMIKDDDNDYNKDGNVNNKEREKKIIMVPNKENSKE